MYILFRQLLFLFPPESVHHFSMNMLRFICSFSWCRKLLKSIFLPEENAQLATTLQTQHGTLHFANPVGLAAGFDKNAQYLRALDCLGFGYVEIGTVTPKPQPGNDKPRLFRLPKDKALINRMGFNNDGAIVIADRLRRWKEQQATDKKPSGLLIGGNIGKNKTTSNEDAWKDYEICFHALFDYVDYFVVNVSSPNTPGLRALQGKEALRKILINLQEINRSKNTPRPILLKIAPDLTDDQINDVVELAAEIQLDGIVAANTTISRNDLRTPASELENIGAGGLSGKPLQYRSTQIVQRITRQTGGNIPLIASGGVFSGRDAVEKFNAGAILVQVWTGFIYIGPSIVKKICRELIAKKTLR